MIVKKSKSTNLRSWKLKDGTIRPLFYEIKKRFPVFLRQYFAGIWDGDGYQSNAIDRRPLKGGGRKLQLTLQMSESGSEPVLKLAEIFDLTLRYGQRLQDKYCNYQPTYTIDLGGPKGELFMLCIYPYCIENRNIIREILEQRKCIDKDYLDRRAQFSWPYLAGYADAEGYYQAKLRHQKAKRKNGSEYIGSSYCFGFVLTSNDIPSLTFIKERLMEAGYKFNKDYIQRYQNTKSRVGRKPETWKPTLQIKIGGGPVALSKFYKNFYMYSLIKKKQKVMRRTIDYSRLIHRK